MQKTSHSDAAVLYFGDWQDAGTAGAGERRSNKPQSACVLTFHGGAVSWLGSKGPDHGQAEVYVDGVLEQTIDTYAPERMEAQVLFERNGLGDGRIHSMRIVVLRERNAAAGDCFQGIAAFECAETVDYPTFIKEAAMAELEAIAGGTKPYQTPDTWRPVPYAAAAPVDGVTLEGGPLRDCFERNIGYLNHCFGVPFLNDEGANYWNNGLPASGEGRLLGGAGHTLRWGERADMRRIVDKLVGAVKSRQTDDGYCLPYDRSFMEPQAVGFIDERRNYDRVNLTRGLNAAGMSGNPDAYGIMRKLYDWLNASPQALKLLTGTHPNSAPNCNNGHAGGLISYFSPVGKADDLVGVERAFVQDYFIEQARHAEPLSLSYYPLHTPHSYVLLAFEAWLDHYRATGAAKYLEAAQGAWRIVHDDYEHVGGTMAICEKGRGDYPPRSYFLQKEMHTGETCGSVFWADINHRFLQLYPEQERYAAEIEKVIFNVILSAQDDEGSIRYHNHLHGEKDKSQCANTCCEVMGVPFIARLPQYLYSVADDGLYVNLFASSRIAWTHAGQQVTLVASTEFPHDGKVTLTLTSDAPIDMNLHLRVPSWVNGAVDIHVNNERATTGKPGSFASLDRTWISGDCITFNLRLSFKLTRYTGMDQDVHHNRYALEHGPLLMALVGNMDLNTAQEDLVNQLTPVAGQPLQFSVGGHPDCQYMPYWQVKAENFTCFPTLR
ncbi:MAG TPA: beta-L-arabinofuranosidase domain-containing protein [Tepidisphaeraceae bacterium]|jgi:hypothetical protein